MSQHRDIVVAVDDKKTTAAGYSERPEVIALAKLRFDREGQPGDWDECVRAVFEGSEKGVAHVLDQVCGEALNRARRDIEDVQTVLKEISGGQ